MADAQGFDWTGQGVAIVGAGVIGRGWAIAFARAGADVRVFDRDAQAAANAGAECAAMLAGLGLAEDETAGIVGRIRAAAVLDEALAGAVWAQESVAEKRDIKAAVFAEMDRAAPPDCILASSCSSIPPAEFMAGLPGERRCLIAHPFNPPHLIPLVELVPPPGAAPETVARARELLTAAGQAPILVAKPALGFVGNRLQAAVACEVMHLVAEGVASPEDIDTCLRVGLGRRWSFMGPLETMDLNAPGGIAEYIAKFGEDYQAVARDLGCAEPWTQAAIDRVVAARRALLPLSGLKTRMAWRDRRLARLRAEDAAGEHTCSKPGDRS